MGKELAEAIGDAARAARLRRKFTQADVAERIGVSNEFYARLERGNALPSLTTLARLSIILKVRPDVLLGNRLSPSRRRPRRPPAPAPAPAPTSARARVSTREEAASSDDSLDDGEDSPALRRLQRRLRRASPEALKVIRMLLKAIEEFSERA